MYLLRYIMNRLRYRFKTIGWPVGFERGVVVRGAEYVSIGNSCFFNKDSSIHVPDEYVKDGTHPSILIEEKVTLGPGSSINAVSSVTIKKNVLIAANVYIGDHIHQYGDISLPIRFQGADKIAPVVIEENAWIGHSAVISPGVTVGKNSVVGANSVVTRNVPDFSLAVGNPAKVVKRYNAHLKKWVRTAAVALLVVLDLPALLLAL